MKASKFTDAQKAFIIRQGEDGTPVAEICRKAGISQATYFNWKKKYAGMMPSEMKRLRELEDENGRLKRIVADLSLMHNAAVRRRTAIVWSGIVLTRPTNPSVERWSCSVRRITSRWL